MAIPSRTQAVSILRSLEPNEKLLRHCSAVGEIAAFLAAAMGQQGLEVDAAVAERAALLHDLDKALAPDDPLRELGHGPAGAEWLRRNGYAELAEAVADHPVGTLARTADYESWASSHSLEARVVAYADKRAIQDVVTLDQRFERWYRKYPDGGFLSVAHERARLLEREVCEAAGLSPGEVQRLPWVEAATRPVA